MVTAIEPSGRQLTLFGEPEPVPVTRRNKGRVSRRKPRLPDFDPTLRPLTDAEARTLAWLTGRGRAVSGADVGAALGLGGWYDLFHLRDLGQAFEDYTGWQATGWWITDNMGFLYQLAHRLRHSGFTKYGADELISQLVPYIYKFARSIRPVAGAGKKPAKMLSYVGAWASKHARKDLLRFEKVLCVPENPVCEAPQVGELAVNAEGEQFEAFGRDDGTHADDRDEFEVLMQRAAKVLDERDWAVLRARFWSRESLADIGARIGVSKERVRQIEAAALERVRAVMGVGTKEKRGR